MSRQNPSSRTRTRLLTSRYVGSAVFSGPISPEFTKMLTDVGFGARSWAQLERKFSSRSREAPSSANSKGHMLAKLERMLAAFGKCSLDFTLLAGVRVSKTKEADSFHFFWLGSYMMVPGYKMMTLQHPSTWTTMVCFVLQYIYIFYWHRNLDTIDVMVERKLSPSFV